ncbi:MAG TPA: nitrate- and nitrite sensing domain-containing protein [Acidimicrobiales bacterium]|nr:nitrate- and nitrite sensing domain-containing protein [Acidimicrobiales bacterium]
MFRRIPIRAKIAAALAVPLLGLVTAATVGASATTASARHAAGQAELALASLGHAGLVTALQDERDLALVDMLGLRGRIALDVDDHATARRRTSVAASELRRALDGQDGEVRDHYTAALERLAELDGLRARVDGGEPAAAAEVFAGYSSIVADLFAAHDRFALGIDDPVLRHGDDLVHGSALAADLAAQLVAELLEVGTGPGGVDRADEVARVAGLRDALERAHAALDVRGTGEHEPAVEELLGNPRVAGLPELAGAAVETGGPVDPAAVLAVAPLGPQGGHARFQDAVVERVEARADELRADAAARRRLFIGGALALVAVTVGVAWLVSRSITRPLRELGIRARQIASYRLPCAVQDVLDTPRGEDVVMAEPDAIEVAARDEVRDVADAFNDVQVAAIALAAEQAALRRNVAESHLDLGRRMQNLLGRLLDALRELHAGEDDPDRRRRLFRVTHLATRLRRNAESLLVLSGAEPAVGWHPPVPVDDVVRGALGEVEQFDRVVVRPLEPVALVGGAAGDVTHLLAELIENGLRHSPPRELVEVSGRRHGDGYEVLVADHGLGMTAEELERANRRLAGAEPFAVTPAKHLGHHVVAVLAARHGITVRLGGDVVAGITAHVTLPRSILTEAPEAAAPAGAVPRPVAAPAPRGRPAVPARGRAGAVPPTTAPAPADRPAPGGAPERTPSGLVRRVPGAARRGPAAPTVAAAALREADGSSSGGVGAEGLRRFLTDLSAGVERSLAAKGSVTDGDEG